MSVCPHCGQTIKEKKIQITFNDSINMFDNVQFVDIEYYKKQFPNVDIGREIAKMEAWLYANPKKRKKNYKRFITSWLSRCSTNTVGHSADSTQFTYGPYSKSKQQEIPEWKKGV